MKILVVGASGRTGRRIVDEALQRGHQVIALVRDSTAFSPRSGVVIVEGSPMEPMTVEKAVKGCDAVIVALNNKRKSEAPWSPPISPKSLIEQSVRNLAASMANACVKRILIVSALGVGDSFMDSPWHVRFLIRKTNVSASYADHNAVDSFIRTTNLDWTLVRPSGLTNRQRMKALVVGTATTPKPRLTISRIHVAAFLLNSLEKSTFMKQAPVISER